MVIKQLSICTFEWMLRLHVIIQRVLSPGRGWLIIRVDTVPHLIAMKPHFRVFLMEQ